MNFEDDKLYQLDEDRYLKQQEEKAVDIQSLIVNMKDLTQVQSSSRLLGNIPKEVFNDKEHLLGNRDNRYRPNSLCMSYKAGSREDGTGYDPNGALYIGIANTVVSGIPKIRAFWYATSVPLDIKNPTQEHIDAVNARLEKFSTIFTPLDFKNNENAFYVTGATAMGASYGQLADNRSNFRDSKGLTFGEGYFKIIRYNASVFKKDFILFLGDHIMSYGLKTPDENECLRIHACHYQG